MRIGLAPYHPQALTRSTAGCGPGRTKALRAFVRFRFGLGNRVKGLKGERVTGPTLCSLSSSHFR
jgi:hypothetical protein